MSQELVSWGIHWHNNDECHAAVISGGIVRDTEGQLIEVDAIQLDSLSLGVVVPTVRNNTAYDNALPYANNSFHLPSECLTE